jgi:DNA-directed RNA polymerase specialized sigma24 family protein
VTAEPEPAELLATLAPVVAALGGVLLPPEQAEPSDTPVVWGGAVVAAVRPADLHGAFDRLLERVAGELGGPLASLSREDKQRAVQLLDEWGAFNFRKSVEDVAQALQVSRFTVYNYLSRAAAAPSATGPRSASREGAGDGGAERPDG